MKINPSKKTSLRFEIALSGAKETPVARLMIKPDNANYYIGIPASVNGGIVEAKITKEMIKSWDFEEGEVCLEVIVGESIFVPWKESLMIEEKFQLDVKPITEAVDEVEVKPSITTTVMFQEDDADEEDPIVEDKPVEEKILPPIKQANGLTPHKGDTELDGDATVVDKAPSKKDDVVPTGKTKKDVPDKPKEKKPKMKPKDYLQSLLKDDGSKEDPTQ